MDNRGRKIQILLVDDNPSTRYTLGRMLRHEGFEVWEADTGFEGLKRVQDGPDLVVLDVELPDIIGYEVCQKIKENPKTALIPVLQVSGAHTSSEAHARGLDKGADAYLTHPINAQVITATANALLRIKKTEMELRVSQERFERVAKAVHLGVWYCDLPSAELTSNEKMREHFWYPSHREVTISDAFERIHSEDRDAAREAALASLKDRSSFDQEFRTFCPADPTKIKFIRAVGWVDSDATGTAIRFDGITFDITLKKATEQSLKEAIRVRDEFLSIASHELKTPLTSLNLQTQAFKRKADRNDSQVYSPEGINKLIACTGQQALRLIRLVDDMMDISRIRTGKLHIERGKVNLFELVTGCLERLKPQIEGNAELICEESSIEGNWDRFRLEQVVNNLVTNAIRYGGGKSIKLRLERSEAAVRLSVQDHGIGIAKDSQERVFDRFERVVQSDRIPGLGLGLYITKQIVLAHDGKIWVESELGKGSTFIVELPLESGAVVKVS